MGDEAKAGGVVGSPFNNWRDSGEPRDVEYEARTVTRREARVRRLQPFGEGFHAG